MSLLELSALGTNERFDVTVGNTRCSEMLLCFTGLPWTCEEYAKVMEVSNVNLVLGKRIKLFDT